jgi:hypothetical protein
MEGDDRCGRGVRGRKERICRESTTDFLTGGPELTTISQAQNIHIKLNLTST